MLDEALLRLAGRRGARGADPPFPLSREFLERVEHLTSFPGRAVAVGRTGAYLPPATCYRLFQALEGSDLPGAMTVTLSGPCFRRERRYDSSRLPAFTMREVVFLGHPGFIEAERRALMKSSLGLARGLGIEARLEEARDPFFAAEDRGKRVLQKLLRLKYELVTDIEGEPVAIGSFNDHRDFFGDRLELRVGGSTAYSGCAAYGVERWALALERRWGPHAREWPGEVRRILRFR